MYYQNNQNKSQKRSEFELLITISGHLSRAKTTNDLIDVLLWNKRIWDIFANDCADENNPFPRELKLNIIKLSMFVNSHTMNILNGIDTDIDILIEINKIVARGLNDQ
ncbi:MAG: flagellar biosynthesis regulator FlaF [Candidimonas sp.]